MKQKSYTPKLNLFVFFVSAISVLLCAFLTSVFSKESAAVIDQAHEFIAANFGWYFMLLFVICVGFVLWLSLSPYGNIKLGREDEAPDFSYSAWIAMLFSSGIGVSLIYYGAYEPLEHFFHPPENLPNVAQAAQNAMVLTFFHWGIHGWALYALMAVILAYYHYVDRRPLNLREALRPLCQKSVDGWLGNVVEAFGSLATVIAMVSNLGIGALLVQAGLHRIFQLPITPSSLTTIIIIMSLLAGIIAIIGIEKGIARLSELNICLLCLLLVFIFFFGNKIAILDGIVQNIGDYLNNFIKLSFKLYTFENKQEWRGLWTIFFWAWWVAWAPFVSLFIAQISKGRTIRELIFGVMFIPLGFTLLWLGIFGNTSLELFLAQGQQQLAKAITDDAQNAVFTLLEAYPITTITIFIATLTCAVLSFAPIDSGCIMISNLCLKSEAFESDSPKWLRLFWCASSCLVTIGLFMADNFLAIQTAVMLCGLPFSVIVILYLISFMKRLKAR